MTNIEKVDVTAPHSAAVFLCYKQERFVEEALRSLLKQQVPLHVWLLDDASPDATWSRVLACLAEVGHGVHHVELLPAVTNGGLTRNWNRAAFKLHEAWIYVFEGDDISMPDRVGRCEDLIRAHPTVTALASRVLEFTADGSHEVPPPGSGGVFTADNIAVSGFPALPGCSLAFRSDVFSVFGRLNWRLMTVDSTLISRSLMLGDLGLIEEPLVRYRKHSGNVSKLFHVDYASLQAFHDSMLAIHRHSLGALHEMAKLRRYCRKVLSTDTARIELTENLYWETRAHVALGMALRRGGRVRLFMTAAANLWNRREFRVSKWALALAVWSDARAAWDACKPFLRRLR